MSGWMNQLQSLLGQKGSSSGEQGLSRLLVPGALGGLAGLLVANKSSRKLLTKYGTGALLAGGGAIAGSVLWNKYKDKMREAGVEEQGRALVAQAIEQPLDPQRLAQGVKNEEEALELYFLSCAAIDIDHFMERSYLNALGDALKIPQDVREGIEQDIQQQKQTLAG